MSGMFFSGFLFISTHIAPDLLSYRYCRSIHWGRWETEQ